MVLLKQLLNDNILCGLLKLRLCITSSQPIQQLKQNQKKKQLHIYNDIYIQPERAIEKERDSRKVQGKAN